MSSNVAQEGQELKSSVRGLELRSSIKLSRTKEWCSSVRGSRIEKQCNTTTQEG
jgi:hypothetical protein